MKYTTSITKRVCATFAVIFVAVCACVVCFELFSNLQKEIPENTIPLPPQKPSELSAVVHEQEYCLAQNIYHEARGSTLADRAAVADVTLNRVNHEKFPKTICRVVKQAKHDKHGNPVKNKCQFSWYCDGKKRRINEEAAWAEAQSLAWDIIHNKTFRGISSGATHYHTTKVRPMWSKKFNLIGQIGAHKYYRFT